MCKTVVCKTQMHTECHLHQQGYLGTLGTTCNATTAFYLEQIIEACRTNDRVDSYSVSSQIVYRGVPRKTVKNEPRNSSAVASINYDNTWSLVRAQQGSEFLTSVS